jgi:regulator of protease activity HflC (stomatin/prohibitin superfamily)
MASNHRDPFRPPFSERLHEVVTPWKLLVVVILLAALGVAAARSLFVKPVPVQANLIRFGSYATEEGEKPLLIVRLYDGTVREVLARRSDVRLCRVGQPVQLMRRGSLLTLQPGGCLQR